MPLRVFKCKVCGLLKETLKKSIPECNHGHFTPNEDGTPLPVQKMTELLTAPGVKMMETTDAFKGKTRMKDQMKILKARSRNHARDREADDMIQFNKNNGIERSGFLGKDGKRRKKVDDI